MVPFLPFLLPAACGSGSTGEKKPPPAAADGGSRPEASGAPPPTAAEPGVCFGKNTSCTQPDFLPAPAETQIAVDCVDGPDLNVEWLDDLGTFECLLPNCPAVNPLVATRAGRYWTVAELNRPDPSSPLGSSGNVVGFAVLAFDDAGHLQHSTTADVRSAIQGAIPPQYTRAIDVAADGSLLWAATTLDKSGIELRRYGPDGKAVAPRLVVPNAIFGHAGWGPDGTAVVAYRVVVQAASGAPFSYDRYAPGVAGFDADGRLLWNQTLLAGFLDKDSSLTSIRVTVAGVDADGNVVLRTADLGKTFDSPSRVLKLDRNGNVVWAREAPDTAAPSVPRLDACMTVLPDGSSLLGALGAQNPQGLKHFVVEKLDPRGNCTWQATLSTETDVNAVAFDDSERAILAEAGDRATTIVVFDKAGPTCTRHALNVPQCVGVDGGTSACGDVSLSAVSHGNLYFGIANHVGVATLP